MINHRLSTDFEEWVSDNTTFPIPAFGVLYSWWKAECGAALLAPASAITPATLKPYLGNLLLVQPLDVPPRFYVRIHGSNLVQRAGYNLDKRFLDDIPQLDFRTLAQRSFGRVFGEGKPLYTLRYRLIDDEVFKYASLFLPFSGEGKIERILVYLMYLDELGEARQ